MSVTISIADNVVYCRENGLIERVEDGHCHFCNGAGCNTLKDPVVVPTQCEQGTWVIENYPFDLNLSNVNWAKLWSDLGFQATKDDDFCGEMDGRTLRTAILAFIKNNDDDENEKLDYYLAGLLKIAHEAESREQKVVWG